MKNPRPLRILPPGASLPATRGKAPNAAFDLWLDRSLKALCESVAAEPLPDELLRLIEADQAKAGDAGEAAGAEDAQHGDAQQTSASADKPDPGSAPRS
jgi:hypothetical protein